MADASPGFQSTVLLVTNNGLGKAESALQEKLAKSYFGLLLESDSRPAAICFYTEGVHLLVDGSPLIPELQVLEDRGVRLIACGTCLNYFDLTEQVAVGIVGGMTDIIEAQRRAAKVITL